MPASGKNAKKPSEKASGGATKSKSKRPGKGQTIPGAKPFTPGCAPGPGRPKGISKATIFGAMRDYLSAEDANGKGRLVGYVQGFFDKAFLDADSWQSKKLGECLIDPGMLDKITTELDATRREDADFIAYRMIKDCFGPQRDYAISKSRISAGMAGRRAGKTEGNVRATGEAVATPGSPVLILGLTFATALQLYWDKLIDKLDEVGLTREVENRTEGHLKLSNGSEVYFRGNSTRDEREKLRGFKWALVIIDEVQSQKALAYLLDEILIPACVDLKGRIKLSGTGPRIRGTYWETLWSNDPTVDKHNWNLLQNPHIPDGAEELRRIREAKGLTESSPLYIREYLGKIAYDDDALVIRLGAGNFYTLDQLKAWIATIPAPDLLLVGGLDIGFEDADGFVVILGAKGRPEHWLLHEYKARREGTRELAEAVKAGIAAAQALIGRPGLECLVFTDTGGGGKKTAYDLQTVYGLPCVPAYKTGKALAVELLQDEVRMGRFRVQAGGPFQDESLKTVFARNEQDELTREVDDETYHPDLFDAILYAMRAFSLQGGKA